MADVGYYDVEARGLAIQIMGYKDLRESLRRADRALAAGLDAALASAAVPVRDEATRRASAIADDGTFGSSISLAMRKGGVVLRSTDPAGAVKELARRGAVTLTSKGTERAQARLRSRSGVGVPAGAPPRAMYAALDDRWGDVVERTRKAVQTVLGSIRGE